MFIEGNGLGAGVPNYCTTVYRMCKLSNGDGGHDIAKMCNM